MLLCLFIKIRNISTTNTIVHSKYSHLVLCFNGRCCVNYLQNGNLWFSDGKIEIIFIGGATFSKPRVLWTFESQIVVWRKYWNFHLNLPLLVGYKNPADHLFIPEEKQLGGKFPTLYSECMSTPVNWRWPWTPNRILLHYNGKHCKAFYVFPKYLF